MRFQLEALLGQHEELKKKYRANKLRGSRAQSSAHGGLPPGGLYRAQSVPDATIPALYRANSDPTAVGPERKRGRSANRDREAMSPRRKSPWRGDPTSPRKGSTEVHGAVSPRGKHYHRR